jgi:GMP synthase-like glutamine amidotransferase
MRILVFQHIPVEHPGVFRDFLAEDEISWDAIELDAGDRIPSLDGYDALWVMGGPMDVWEEERHPWLAPEKAAIREAVNERRMPFLGVCLGHQLLAAALGGRVAPMKAPEVGILDVRFTPEGARDRLFGGLASPIKCLQWHGAEVVEPPADATVLASSPACTVQAVSRRADGVDDLGLGCRPRLPAIPRTHPRYRLHATPGCRSQVAHAHLQPRRPLSL